MDKFITEPHKPYRKDKYFKLGSHVLEYIHYYPTYNAEVSYGWLLVRKEGLLDIYFGKHVFVFTLKRIRYYDLGRPRREHELYRKI